MRRFRSPQGNETNQPYCKLKCSKLRQMNFICLLISFRLFSLDPIFTRQIFRKVMRQKCEGRR
jgi:hypothetical protein